MPNIYITDETKQLIEHVASLDQRTQDGEINFLCKDRLKQLNLTSNNTPQTDKVQIDD